MALNTGEAPQQFSLGGNGLAWAMNCPLYTSDAADESRGGMPGGRTVP